MGFRRHTFDHVSDVPGITLLSLLAPVLSQVVNPVKDHSQVRSFVQESLEVLDSLLFSEIQAELLL